MTSTKDTTGHPDVAEISDLTEGLLAPSRSADVRRHLDDCELCADVHASLEEIRGLLGSVPGPPRMPDDVAHRIDAALAAEALLNATAPENADTSSSVDSVTTGTDALHVSRETTTAADRPAGRGHAATGPGRKERKRGGRRRIAVLGAVLTVAALGLGSVLVSSLTDGGGPGTSAHQSTGPDTFSASGLEGQVNDLLTKVAAPRGPHSLGIQGTSEAASPGDQSTKILRQPVVPSCVQQGIGRDDTALAVEEGTYQGKDALLVVLPDTSDSTRIDAYLMDKTCVDHPSASPARVLLTNSYPRR
ncbi:anti-sigma factor family protein [Streptomyces sp. NPDC002962]|uniref:anti-sigma factor family protein n=1 Tax=Streptomyces sp. NPDC002962 TaxID=3364674 RepID=UPI0036A2AF0C